VRSEALAVKELRGRLFNSYRSWSRFDNRPC